MGQIFTEDDYIRCDIVTGRLYRCLTSLFQEFLDVQFSAVLGERWIEQIVALAGGYFDKDMVHERNNLSALLKKRDELGLLLMNKGCIDVTIANTLMLFTCYYLTSVPRYDRLSNEDMADILARFEKKPPTSYARLDTAALRGKLTDCIKADINILLMCQGKMAREEIKDGKTLRRKNGRIENDDFYKKIQRLTNNKNRLNSHMSSVSDPIASEREITDTIMNLEEFLNYLATAWEYEQKEEFLERFRKELNIIRYLRSTTKFADIMSAVTSVIASMPPAVTPPTPPETPAVTPPAPPETPAVTPPVPPADGERHLRAFKKAFALLSNASNHSSAYTALTIESVDLDDPCATIMLAFMYHNGWVVGGSAEEALMPILLLSDPKEWLATAESLKASRREQAAAYYIGHALANHDPSAFKMAGYLGVRLANFEVTKACFKHAGETDAEAMIYYKGISALPDEAAFKSWAAEQNKKR